MLGSLTGSVKGRLANRTLIEVSGVGYWVHTGSWQPEGELTAYLFHYIREDINDLYGFVDLPTLALFEKLISVSGIGPKAALALLSIGSTDQLKQAILQGDAAYLSSAPGVGQKAAQKLIVELQNKMDILPSSAPLSQQSDLLAALEGLGYRSADIHKVLRELPKELTTLDEQIKWCLQQF